MFFFGGGVFISVKGVVWVKGVVSGNVVFSSVDLVVGLDWGFVREERIVILFFK